MKKEYNILLNNGRIIDCDIKDLLHYNPKLVLEDYNKDEVYCCDNIQSLYMYPLSIVDYINNLNDKKIIFLNIIDVDINIDYEVLFNKDIFKSIKAVEILIKEDYSDDKVNKICEIIKYFMLKKVLISLNIKNIIKISNLLNKYLKYISYFKIFLDNKINKEEYLLFLDKLLLISKNSSKRTLIHVKTYLSISQIDLYEKMIEKFSLYNVDIFQVSKELIPLDSDNIKVENNYQSIIRNLEEKYSTFDKCKFISVKDISTLYYPRFELDERNSRVCYVSKMKPYLYNDKLIPCKVSKVLSNVKNWELDYNDYERLNDVLSKCGVRCDDCASMFENDLLYAVDNMINKYKCRFILKE